MNRITHECLQGSAEWLSLRSQYLTASEASAALGASKYQKRADLIKQKATGIVPDVDSAKQRLFDAGHAAEAAARPIVEVQLGTELFPVTMSAEVDGLPLLASLDGISMFGDIIWENKLLNESLKDDVQQGQLHNHYAYQVEQQLLVSGAEKCYFTTSDGTPEGTFGMWYESCPKLRAALIAGWKQFESDVAAYQHVETVAAPVADSIEELPALSVSLVGQVTSSNLATFKDTVLARIQAINTTLVTDADFVNADKMVKFLDDGEKRLELVKSQALSQTATIDELFRTIDGLKAEMRSKRLTLDKLVKSEKENRKSEIVTKANAEFAAHIQALDARIGMRLPMASPQLAESIKGLKSLDSMRDKVSVALANAKIEANAIADRIEANRKTVEDMSLFPDFAQVCAKAPEDFAALVAMRISQRQARLDAEREKIRAEEQAKAQREAAAEAKRIADAKLAEEHAAAVAEIRKIDAERKEAQEAAAKSEAERIAALPTVVEVEPHHIEQPRAMVEPIATGKTIKLGEICLRLGFTITADFLASLGFDPVATEKNAKLYQEASFPVICRALQRHINDVATGTVRLAA